MLFLLVTIGCRKDHDQPVTSIDPVSQPSELSRSLIIKGGDNKKGTAPAPTTSSDLKIIKFQPSARIAADNYLFIPLIVSASEKVRGMYLQVKGADNYWEISAVPDGDNSAMLSVSIPANILNGDFDLLYGLIGISGAIGSPADLKTSIVSPVDYCSGGSSPGSVDGTDGITVSSFTLGNQAGWVSIVYDTYTVPDRIDVRYGNHWIRSTGSLLTGNEPPAKTCSAVTSGDGFVGESSVFNFFYDPSKSQKLDIYVSGCLEGGTKWTFQIKECPKDMPVLGVHSVDGRHSWVSLTQNGDMTFYGLWPDLNPNPRLRDHNILATDLRIDVETGIGKYNRYYPLSESQLAQFNLFVSKYYIWTAYYNCAAFAEDLVKTVTGETVSAGIVPNPTTLGESIEEKEVVYPTASIYTPPTAVLDNTSCSLCY